MQIQLEKTPVYDATWWRFFEASNTGEVVTKSYSNTANVFCSVRIIVNHWYDYFLFYVMFYVAENFTKGSFLKPFLGHEK